MMRGAWLVAAAILGGSASSACAQPRVVEVVESTCASDWLDRTQLLRALRIELAESGLEVRAASEDRASDAIPLRLACDEGSDVVELTIGAHVERVVLSDLEREARLRALAMTAAARLGEVATQASNARSPLRTEPVRRLSAADGLSVPTSGGLAPTDRMPAIERPERDDGIVRELRLQAGATIALATDPVAVFGGGRLDGELVFDRVPITVRAGALACGGGNGDPLGRVHMVAVGGLAAIGLDIRIDQLRIAPRAEIAFAGAAIDAQATAAGWTAHDRDVALVWLAPSLYAGFDIDAFTIGLDLGVAIVLAGFEATAEDRRVIAERGVRPSLTLAVGGRIR